MDVAIINLKEAGLHHELEDGSLYTKLQRKLPESLLARYHRWIFENSMSESVLTLRTWVIQESEFQTVASETVYGLTGKASGNQPLQPLPRNNNQRAFFGETEGNDRATKTYHVSYAESRMGFGSALSFWKNLCPNDGMYQRCSSYVIVVWRKGMPGNRVREVARAVRIAAESYITGCYISNGTGRKLLNSIRLH